MKIIDNIKEGVRNSMRQFLQIEDNNKVSFNVQEEMNEETWLFKNEILYRQKPSELSEFYKNLNLGDNSFWSNVPTKGLGTVKKCSGIPKILVDVMANMITRDLNAIVCEEYQEIVDDTLKENEFKKMVNKALKQALSQGDGVFVPVVDKEVSEYPILQFYPAKNVKYVRRYGRIIKIITTDTITFNTHKYFLKTTYGYGYVHYSLEDRYGKECNNLLHQIPETEYLQDDDTLPKDVILAIPFFPLGYSGIYDGRGKSMYEGKDSIYDTLDEIISSWASAIRKSQAYKTIDKKSIPVNPETGEPLYSSNDFDNIFIEVDTPRSEHNNQSPVNIYQPEIPSENYKAAWSVFLDLALAGDESAATIGIDSDKINANAEAEREREKSTMYMRNMIIESLTETLQKLIVLIINVNNLWLGSNSLVDASVEINFNDYNSPSWETQARVLIEMYNAGIISIESVIEELYGDDKEEEWKKEEIDRILKEHGIMINLEEPSVGDNLDEGVDEDDI